MSDMAELARICSATLDLEGFDAALLPSILASEPAPAGALRVVHREQGRVVAGALATAPGRVGETRVGYLDLLVVSPESQGRGLGRALLTTVADRLRSIGVSELRVGGNAPVYAWPGVDPGYTAMTCLLERTGFERRGDATNMTVVLADASGAPTDALGDLVADEQALRSEGVRFDRAGLPAREALEQWFRPWGGHWAEEAGRAIGRVGGGCHVASAGGEVLGAAVYGANRPSWFGPMATTPAAQGRGIGSVLLRRCLADQRALGAAAVEISWVGPRHFYARVVGARVRRLFWLYARAL